MTTVAIETNPYQFHVHHNDNARAFRRDTSAIVTVSSSSSSWSAIAGRGRACLSCCVERRSGLRWPGSHSDIFPASHGGQRFATAAEQQKGGGHDDNRSNSRSRSSSKSIGGRNQTVSKLECDVVIVGAGIIGIATAHHVLQNTNLSVALIDSKQPCAGATGAGQGYIWMSHRMPGNPLWDLASRSKCLWEELAMELRAESIDPLKAMGWRNTGSMLLASSNDENESLQNLVAAASAAGVPAEFLSAPEARRTEPAIDHLAGAAFFPEDSQIDARLAVEVLQQRIRTFGSAGRYKELFQTPVHQFIRSPIDGRIQGVKTQKGDVYSKKAVVIATGAWSSSMMSKATAEWSLSVVPPVKPRKGHLLVLKGAESVQLRHGLMEFGYLSHAEPYDSGAPDGSEVELQSQSSLEVAMTATMDQDNNLLLGSSREFVDFNDDVRDYVVESIMSRARKFFGALSHVSLKHALQSGSVRTGFRPFIGDGRPLIGRIEDAPGLIFATGHAGSGLCLSLGTAEMVVNIIQDVGSVVEGSFFSPVGRLVSPSEI